MENLSGKRKIGFSKTENVQGGQINRRLEKKASNVSSPAPVFTVAPCESANLSANCSSEAELKKARALEYWQGWLDRPK